jgi:two-component system nitrogen regulation response regulator GlnG
MSNSALDASTAGLTQGDHGPRPGRSGELPDATRVPALTVIWAPDPARIGHRALLAELLAGRDALVSRAEPAFAAPDHPTGASIGEAIGQPLADSFLSRQPFRLRPAADGSLLMSLAGSRTRVHVDGIELADPCRFEREQIDAGVCLTLADRIVLLLHHTSARARPAESDLGLIGASPAMQRVRDDIRRVADVDVPVLVRGESGTGKELVATALHALGPRRDRPLVSVNLGAVPPSLAFAELFGAAAGAYTGASRAREGYFRQASRSTLFLDEVGEAARDVQVMLLRALETGEIQPLGAPRPERVDVRLITATDANLDAMVRAGDFRAPLLHRLAGYEIWLPPLRERREDIGRLLLAFVRRELAAIGNAGALDDRDPARPPWLPADLVVRLVRHDWPGNVRELRNVARQLVLGSRGCDTVEPSAPLLHRLRNTPAPAPGQALAAGTEPGAPRPVASPPAAAEPPSDPDLPAPRRRPADVPESVLIETLAAHDWDIAAAARALNLSRPSMYMLIEKSDAIRTAADLDADEIRRCHEACGGDLDAMVARLRVSRNGLRRRMRDLRLD